MVPEPLTLKIEPKAVPVAAKLKSPASTPFTLSEKVTVYATREAFVGELLARLIEETVGAEVSMVMFKPGKEAVLTLPATSLAFAVSVCVPAVKADEVMLQLPSVAVAVPSTTVPPVSYNVTVDPASAVPVKVGVVLLVMLSTDDVPLSEPAVISGVEGAAGAVVSST